MKVHFDGPRRPARVAKLLRSELAAAGIHVGLAKAQDVAAHAFGYATYKELQSLAGREKASAWDEDCPEGVVAERRRRQADALVRAGMERPAAEGAVARIKPSGKNLGAPVGRPGPGTPDGVAVPLVVTGGVHGQVGLRVLPVDASPDVLASLLRFEGSVITAEGGPVPLQDGQRRYVAALDNGILLISGAHRATGPVSSARALLQRSHFQVTRILFVEMEVIGQVYEADTKRRNREAATVPAVEFMALVRLAAERRAGNLHVVAEAEGTSVFLRGAGREWPLPGMGHGDGLETCRDAFELSEDQDDPYRSYKPYGYQAARIVGDRLPDGVLAVSLQFNPLTRGGRQLIARLHYAHDAGAHPGVGLRGLGYTAEQERLIVRMRRRASGINLIAGPPGSGRFTSLGRIVDAGAGGAASSRWSRRVPTAASPASRSSRPRRS